MNGRTITMWEMLDARIGLLATGNIAGAVANNLVANVDAVLHLLVAAGQVGVAIVTIWYIVKKIRNLPKKPRDEKD